MDKVKDYTYTKGIVEKYVIRWNRGEWAVFTIDNASGLMQCHSSFGDWSYYWPRHKCINCGAFVDNAKPLGVE